MARTHGGGEGALHRSAVRTVSMFVVTSTLPSRWYSVHKYFDGKTTADEIQYRCEVSRTQLREVLYAFDRHVSEQFVRLR